MRHIIARLGQVVVRLSIVGLMFVVIACTTQETTTQPILINQKTSTASPNCVPQITSVSSFAAGPTQNVSIQGSCFGIHSPFSQANSPYFKIAIDSSSSPEWHACYTGDSPTDFVTCNVPSWTNNSITFSGFTGSYGQNGWVVNSNDLLTIEIWNPQTDKGPGTCELLAGSAGNAQCNKCTPDYCTPAKWNTLAVGGLTPGVEPLNVIISARSTVPLGKILTALNNWSEVSTGSPPSGCLSPEEANVTGSNAIQDQSWRLKGCYDGGYTLAVTGQENHARLWHQSVPGSEFVAWFISASYETACVSLHGKLKPLRSLNGTLRTGNPWHCIDGNPTDSYNPVDSNNRPLNIGGYDAGAANLAAAIVQAAPQNGWRVTQQIDTRSVDQAHGGDIGENGVHFTGAVYVLTVDSIDNATPGAHLSSSYIGTGHNITYNETGSLTLSSITEDQQGNISGQVTWGSPLCGSGPFTGKVSANNTLSFTTTKTDGSACEVITNFTGTINPQNNSMSGNYSTATQTGTWQVSATP